MTKLCVCVFKILSLHLVVIITIDILQLKQVWEAPICSQGYYQQMFYYFDHTRQVGLKICCMWGTQHKII